MGATGRYGPWFVTANDLENVYLEFKIKIMLKNFLIILLSSISTMSIAQKAWTPAVVTFPSSNNGQSLFNTTSRSNGLDPQLAKNLQDTLNLYLQLGDAVGLCAAMLFPDGSVWKGASGVHALPAVPLDTFHAMGMGSISKTITAMAIMKLWDEGKLLLDDPVQSHIGSFPNINSSITIRQCLNHTSGVYDYTNNPALGADVQGNPTKIFTPEEILNTYVLAPLFTPGTSWSYCNTNYILAGKVVEAVSGEAYHTYVRNQILQPLGLDSITLGVYEAATDPRANPWAVIPGFGKLDIVSAGFSLNSLFSSAWAAGAWWATPHDISRMLKSLLKGEILSPVALAEMQNVIPILPEFGYGLGLIKYNVLGVDAWGHAGNILFKSVGLYIPFLDLALTVMSNDAEFVIEGPTAVALIQGWLDFTSSTEDFSPELSALKLYPNPAYNSTYLEGLKADMTVRIIDAQGRVTAYWTARQDTTVRLQDILQTNDTENPGMHWVQVQYQGKTRILPMIIGK